MLQKDSSETKKWIKRAKQEQVKVKIEWWSWFWWWCWHSSDRLSTKSYIRQTKQLKYDSMVKSSSQLKEWEESWGSLMRNSLLHLLLKEFCNVLFIGLTVRHWSYFVTCQVHELGNAILDNVSNVKSGRRTSSWSTESACLFQETLFKQMERTTGRREVLVLIRDILENIVDHPCPFVDTRVNRFRNSFIHDAVHVFQEFLSTTTCLASNFESPFHVSDSEREQLPRQALVAFGMLFHALDWVAKNPFTRQKSREKTSRERRKQQIASVNAGITC